MENESDCDSGECGIEGGDGHAKGTSPAGIPLPLPHPSLHPIPNQSKPIVQLPLSFSLITSRYNSITFHYNHYNY